MRTIGENGLDLIRHCEGTVYHVYLDSSGYPTGGTGHLIRNADHLKLGDPVSPEQEEAWLKADLADAEAAVNRHAPDLATQNAFDALTDFAFNEGEANLAELVGNAGGVSALIAEHLSHYTRSGTDHPRGLRIRRALERDLFLAPDGPMPEDWLQAHDHDS